MSDDYWATCPKCRSPRISVYEDDRMFVYLCGTIYCGGMCDSQSPMCYDRQVYSDYQRATTKTTGGAIDMGKPGNCKVCRKVAPIGASGLCTDCFLAERRMSSASGESPDLKEFLDELIALCRQNLPAGHSGCWGESPIELVTDIINERDDIKDESLRLRSIVNILADHVARAKGTTVPCEIRAATKKWEARTR